MSPRLLPVVLEEQLVPGTFADAVHRLVDVLDLSAFDAHYRNDTAGAPAHSPGMLLKAVLLAYSQGIVSSRRIEHVERAERSETDHQPPSVSAERWVPRLRTPSFLAAWLHSLDWG
jgi:hypothetical protein